LTFEGRIRNNEDLHFALKLVSVKLSGFALVLPTFNFAFCRKSAMKTSEFSDFDPPGSLFSFLSFFSHLIPLLLELRLSTSQYQDVFALALAVNFQSISAHQGTLKGSITPD
jgi:hypothetical protein